MSEEVTPHLIALSINPLTEYGKKVEMLERFLALYPEVVLRIKARPVEDILGPYHIEGLDS